MKPSGVSPCLICMTVILIVFTCATDSVIEITGLPFSYLEDDKIPLLNTVSVENERVTLQFQKKCPAKKDKMIQNINEVLETHVGVPNEDCKCVNVKPGPLVKKYRKWYLFQPKYHLPTFIVELQGPKSKMVKANIEENQIILKRRKYFVVRSVCDVCFRGAEEIQMILLHCNELHMYCAQCITQFPQKRCPLCKELITRDARLFDKIKLIGYETIFLPSSLFDQYMISSTQPLLITIGFTCFEDAYWKPMFFSYVRFFSANALAIVAEILTKNPCVFDHVGESLWPTIDCVALDIRWLMYAIVANNTNRFVKYITSNKIGIDISLFAPTILAMWIPIVGMVAQEIVFYSVHSIFLVSLLRSANKFSFKLFLISYLLVVFFVINVIFLLHTNTNHQFSIITEVSVLINFPHRYFFIPILNGLVFSIILILKNGISQF